MGLSNIVEIDYVRQSISISTSGALFIGQLTVEAARRVDAHLHAEKVKKEYSDSRRDFREVRTTELFGLTAGMQKPTITPVYLFTAINRVVFKITIHKLFFVVVF